MSRLAPIIGLSGLIGLGGCATGVGYGPYGGTYYSNAYPVPGYGYDYGYGYPYGPVGLGGIWIGGGHRDWHRWHAFYGHPHWGAWHSGAFHAPGAWAGRGGHWAGHSWHH